MKWRKRKNICRYWDCNKSSLDNHFVCDEHHQDWVDGLLDKCPNCGRLKDVMYYFCLDCYFGRRVIKPKPPAEIPNPDQHFKVEFSEAWTDGYMGPKPERVFVYVLTFADGGLYAGHTTDIREQLSEHREAKIPFTAGRNPELKYMEIAATMKDAEMREVELKRLIETNPRQIHLMISKFSDHMVEFELE